VKRAEGAREVSELPLWRALSRGGALVVEEGDGDAVALCCGRLAE
jgi:hypothetical protein